MTIPLKQSSHDYSKFAASYANLGIEDTFYLAYRDIPALIAKHVKGQQALDHGCGGGRSTRLLQELGLTTVGVDTSTHMIDNAKGLDPSGTYLHIQGSVLPFRDQEFDLVLQSIVLLEIASREEIIKTLRELTRVLKNSGVFILIASSEESYSGQSASFDCDFPENYDLKSGQQGKCIVRGTDVVFWDYFWNIEDYKDFFKGAELSVVEHLRPLATGEEPYTWYSETEKPWWDIYVLRKSRLVNNIWQV